MIYSASSVQTWFNTGQRVHLLHCLCKREDHLKIIQSPTENYRDITLPSIKDDNSPFPHLISGADLCRQPLAEWLKQSINKECWDHGNKGIQMRRGRRQPPAARISPSFSSIYFSTPLSHTRIQVTVPHLIYLIQAFDPMLVFTAAGLDSTYCS